MRGEGARRIRGGGVEERRGRWEMGDGRKETGCAGEMRERGGEMCTYI